MPRGRAVGQASFTGRSLRLIAKGHGVLWVRAEGREEAAHGGGISVLAAALTVIGNAGPVHAAAALRATLGAARAACIGPVRARPPLTVKFGHRAAVHARPGVHAL